jgi:hypothetical protein|tara:strand:+ start:40278 stop:40604 length:327 start_codon:yes stop_codon:yes gene_type:complete
MELLLKAIIGGIVIATVSTVGQRYPTIGAFVLGVPLATFVSFIFMHYAGVDVQTFKTISIQTVYFVLISLLFFPVFVFMLPQYGFLMSMLSGVVISGSLMLLLLKYVS